jgi:hypothetical protein
MPFFILTTVSYQLAYKDKYLYSMAIRCYAKRELQPGKDIEMRICKSADGYSVAETKAD